MNTLIALWTEPADREAFDADYDENHLPIVQEWPGLVSVSVYRREDVIDPPSATPPYVTLVARFGSQADVSALLSGPVGAAAADAARLSEQHGVRVELLTAQES